MEQTKEKWEIELHLRYENCPIVISVVEFLEEVNKGRLKEEPDYTVEDVLIGGAENLMLFTKYSLDANYYSDKVH